MLPLVVQVEQIDSKTADTCAFRRSPVRVGRNPLNDLVLEELYVSQWHAVIRFDATRVVYLDLGSTNPTLLDGKPVARNIEIEIRPDSDLRIGRLRLHLLRDQVAEEFFGMRRKSAFSEGPSGKLPNSMTTMYVPARNSSPGNASGGDVMARLLGISSAGAGDVAAAPPRGTPAAEAAQSALAQTVATPSAHPVQPPSGPSPAHPRGGAPSYEASPSASVPPAGLSESYAHYRSAWRNLLQWIRRDLEMHAAHTREERIQDLQEQFPGIHKEPEFRELVAEFGVDPMRTGEPEITDWFRRLTGGAFPPPGAPINQAMAMERVGAMLEVFADGFVALRKSQEEFASAMSLRADEESTSGLSQLEVSTGLLAHLMDPGPGGHAHIDELRRAIADLSLHHVGIVGAVVEGARALLQKLSPDEVTGDASPSAGLLGRFSRNPEGRKWQAYVQAFERLQEEDRFTRTLFGRAFARRYYQSVAGRRPSQTPDRPR